MSVLTGTNVRFEQVTNDPATGLRANPTSIVGTLVVNGDDTGTTVTITNKATGLYKISCVMPTLAIGDIIQIRLDVVYSGITYYYNAHKDIAEGNLWNMLRSGLTLTNSIGKALSDFLSLYVGPSGGGGGGGTNFLLDWFSQLFNNTAIAGIGDTTGLPGSAVPGFYYLSLHTADPTGGNQTTNETTYGGYVRIAIVRSAVGWTVSGGVGVSSVINAALQNFATVTSGSGTITHLGIGSGASGATELLFALPIDSAFTIATGNRPSFPAGNISVTIG